MIIVNGHYSASIQAQQHAFSFTTDRATATKVVHMVSSRITVSVVAARDHCNARHHYRRAHVRYDTIRDAILTCARKPTWIGLIYRMETTTKNVKQKNWKAKADMLEVTVKVWGIMQFVLKKRKKGCSGKDLQKKVLSLEWKREWVMKN